MLLQERDKENFFEMKWHLLKNNTWAQGDMKFLFESSTQNFASERSERVRCRVEPEKGNYISPSNHVYTVYCINISLTRRSRLNWRLKKMAISTYDVRKILTTGFAWSKKKQSITHVQVNYHWNKKTKNNSLIYSTEEWFNCWSYSVQG